MTETAPLAAQALAPPLQCGSQKSRSLKPVRSASSLALALQPALASWLASESKGDAGNRGSTVLPLRTSALRMSTAIKSSRFAGKLRGLVVSLRLRTF